MLIEEMIADLTKRRNNHAQMLKSAESDLKRYTDANSYSAIIASIVEMNKRKADAFTDAINALQRAV